MERKINTKINTFLQSMKQEIVNHIEHNTPDSSISFINNLPAKKALLFTLKSPFTYKFSFILKSFCTNKLLCKNSNTTP